MSWWTPLPAWVASLVRALPLRWARWATGKTKIKPNQRDVRVFVFWKKCGKTTWNETAKCVFNKCKLQATKHVLRLFLFIKKTSSYESNSARIRSTNKYLKAHSVSGEKVRKANGVVHAHVTPNAHHWENEERVNRQCLSAKDLVLVDRLSIG